MRPSGEKLTGNGVKLRSTSSNQGIRMERSGAATHASACRKPAKFLPQAVSPMLRWSIAFFIMALIEGMPGFGGIAGAAAGIAKRLLLSFRRCWCYRWW
jgi:uncharacterized membrane protein YtjA (UPF0391 family)